MSGLWAAYATALTLGAAHALEVDHMVGVSAFVGGTARLGPAVSFGVRWGVGHSVVVLVTGGLLAWSRITVPPPVQHWTEFGVGLALVGVGIWAWRNGRRLHVHGPERHGGHAHLHAHPSAQNPHGHHHGRVHRGAGHPRVPERGGHAHAFPHVEGRHARVSTLVGAVHGLAGTAPVVALIPVTLMPSLGEALAYLVAFGAGTTAGMAVYAALAALALSRTTSSLRLARSVALGTAAASAAVGGWWLVSTAVGMG